MKTKDLEYCKGCDYLGKTGKEATCDYKSMPERESDRRLLARLVRMNHDLLGIHEPHTVDGAVTRGRLSFLPGEVCEVRRPER